MDLYSRELDQIWSLIGPFDIIYCFPVYHQGWDCDEWGWVAEVRDTGERKIILTSHGSPYVASVEELKNCVHYYSVAIYKTEHAIKLVMDSEE